MQFLTIGMGFYTFAVLLVPLTDALDADRFLVSLALSVQTLTGALLGPWVGRMVAERSVRVLMFGGMLTLSAGFLLLAQASTLWHLYAAFGLIVTVGMTFCGPLPCNTLLANWFAARRGTALGISQFGVSLSGTVLVPVAGWIVVEYGWQAVPLTFALALPLVMTPLIWKLAIKRPEDVGLHADGALEAPAQSGPGGRDWTFAKALRDPQVWLLAAVVGVPFMGVGMVVLGMHSHITDVGLSVLEASAIVAVITACGALAKLLFGVLADRFDKRAVVSASLGLQILGLASIMGADTELGFAVAGGLFGLGYGGALPLWSVLIATMFGPDAFARVMGFMGPMTVPFTLSGLPLATYVFEHTGSYLPAFGALLAALCVALVATWRLRIPASP